MKKALVIIFSVITIFTFIFAVAGIFVTDYTVQQEVESLSEFPKSSKIESFDYVKLNGLPSIVQKYFRLNIKRNADYIKIITFTFKGELKLADSSKWIELNAQHYYSAIKPGYVWDARYVNNGFVEVRNIEKLLNNNGSVISKYFSSINIDEHFSELVTQSLFVKYLTEAVFFPTFLLPSKYIKWEGISFNKAKVIFSIQKNTYSAICTFNKNGELIAFETEDRYKLTEAGYVKSKYVISYSNYRRFGHYSLPTKLNAKWVDDEKSVPFIRGTISKVKFNNFSLN